MSPEQITIIIAFIGNLIIVYFAFYKEYRETKGKNEALIEDIHKITYEETKGKNLATQEDIAQITKEIESVKTELNYLSQSKLILADKQYEIYMDTFQSACVAFDKSSSTPSSSLNHKELDYSDKFQDALNEQNSFLRKIHLVSLCDNSDEIYDLFKEIHKINLDTIKFFNSIESERIKRIHTIGDKVIQEKDQEDFTKYLHDRLDTEYKKLVGEFNTKLGSLKEKIRTNIKALYVYNN